MIVIIIIIKTLINPPLTDVRRWHNSQIVKIVSK